MSKFDISYEPRATIKAQAMVDFVAEFAEPNVDPSQMDTDANNNMG